MWRDPGRTLMVVGFTLTTFSTLVVVLRLFGRYVQKQGADVSDCIMVLALLSEWITTVLNSYQTWFGKDATLSRVQHDPHSARVQAALSGILITWFIYRPLYILTLSLVKLSILTFYRTLVPPSTPFRSFRSYRYMVSTLIIFIILYSLSTIAASIFQCTPISAAYSVASSSTQILKHSTRPGPRCYEPNAIWLFVAIVNFATDIAIFLLPIPLIASLQNMPLRKRIEIFCIFSIGTLAIAASAVRMWILVLWAKNISSRNKYGTDLLTWGQVEVNCGIVGASAMFLRPLFKRCFKTKIQSERASDRLDGPKQVTMKAFEVKPAN